MVMLGVNLSWPAVAGTLILLLIGVGMMLGGLPGLLVGNLATLSATGATPVLIGVAVGGLVLILILTAPLVWLDGMRQVFLSSIWTLTYRQINDRETVAQETSPERPAPEAQSFAPNASGLAR